MRPFAFEVQLLLGMSITVILGGCDKPSSAAGGTHLSMEDWLEPTAIASARHSKRVTVLVYGGVRGGFHCALRRGDTRRP